MSYHFRPGGCAIGAFSTGSATMTARTRQPRLHRLTLYVCTHVHSWRQQRKQKQTLLLHDGGEGNGSAPSAPRPPSPLHDAPPHTRSRHTTPDDYCAPLCSPTCVVNESPLVDPHPSLQPVPTCTRGCVGRLRFTHTLAAAVGLQLPLASGGVVVVAAAVPAASIGRGVRHGEYRPVRAEGDSGRRQTFLVPHLPETSWHKIWL